MPLSAFDLFKIGIGPSSSHTVGPMRAAHRFVLEQETAGLLSRIARIETALYGSLALTGKGHDTDKAVILGLCGELPEKVDPDAAVHRVAEVRTTRRLLLLGRHPVAFDEPHDLQFRQRETLPRHPNGMRFRAFDAAGGLLAEGVYFSVGGGFVLSEAEAAAEAPPASNVALPFPFRSAEDLLVAGRATGKTIADLLLANEQAWRSEGEVREGLLGIWRVMEGSIERGMRAEGVLPGSLRVKRRAPGIWRDLTSRPEAALRDQLTVLDWVNLYALAVNEENAAGGRVVTAPTNGAAGVIPAVLAYYTRFVPGASDDGVVRFLLTAAAIGMLYKENASISAAEVGCQGEVGVACSMAAGALCAVLGGSNEQVENAAEIGMEHNLGLTCDPIGGLVQIPCIERNTMGAIKAINAARLALRGDGSHFVPLDKVIETMRQTGKDMMDKYKETSLGGLAVNVVEC
ncbi:MAG: L-serine ammonia-lyase [Geminicoccaceae bacterium]